MFRERWDELLTLLGKNHAHIGVSLLFTELGRLRMGYDQARTAIEIGPASWIPMRWSITIPSIISTTCSNATGKNSRSMTSLVRYLDQLAGERGYSNSNLLLLYHYLNTERNISLTAKRVHMHRNSVIYRLQRIQDVLNLDLDDPDVRPAADDHVQDPADGGQAPGDHGRAAGAGQRRKRPPDACGEPAKREEQHTAAPPGALPCAASDRGQVCCSACACSARSRALRSQCA